MAHPVLSERSDHEPIGSQPASAVASRRPRSRRALRLLLAITMASGYMNALLRVSYESQVTVFRLLFPVLVVVMCCRFALWPATRTMVAFAVAVLAYSVAQMSAFGLIRDPLAWSYLINIVALIAFVYLVYMNQQLFGGESLRRHLYAWYKIMVVLSVHQLLTGVVYPHMVIDQTGYAPIWYGQVNDASLAIGAFIPLLVDRSRGRRSAVLWLLVGLAVLYLNNTRGVVLAVAFYLAMLALTPVLRFFRRVGMPAWMVPVLTVTALASGVLLFQDVEITLSDEVTSLRTMVVDPIREALAGQKMIDQLTSINLRVTTAVAGLERLRDTYGFGVGPGGSTSFVLYYYEGIARSMHLFPLQLLVESGWLFVVVLAWVVVAASRRVGAARAGRALLFCALVASSATSGAITNYFFFACAVAMLTARKRSSLSREMVPAIEPESAIAAHPRMAT